MNSEALNLAERIRVVAKLCGGEGALATKSDIPARSIQAYLSGTAPPAERLVAIADAPNPPVSIAWLVSGRGPMREEMAGATLLQTGDGRKVAFQVNEHPMAASLAGSRNVKVLEAPYSLVAGGIPVIGEIDIDDAPAKRRTEAWSDGDYVYVPLYDVKAGAGHGQIPIGERVIGYPVFMRSFVEELRKKWPGMEIHHLGMGGISGDSMLPDLADESATLFTRHDRGQGGEGIFYLRAGEGVICKNVQPKPAGGFRIYSSNPSPRYRDFELTDDEAQDAIIARVIWGARTF